jgi:hypothetical protein
MVGVVTIDDLVGLVDDFSCEIKSYKVHGEGSGFQQHQHIKFTIAVTVNTNSSSSSATVASKAPAPEESSAVAAVATGKSQSKSKKLKRQAVQAEVTRSSSSRPIAASTSAVMQILTRQSTTSVEIIRRYSDFELLSSILRRFYPSCITPPLPPKAWSLGLASSISEAVSIQRSRELQLFLNHLTRHPVLRHVYEVKAFLESSASGFRSYRELYPRLEIDRRSGQLRISSEGGNHHGSPVTSTAVGIMGMLGASSSVAMNTIAQSKAYGIASNIFGSMRQVITSPITSIASSITSSASAASSSFAANGTAGAMAVMNGSSPTIRYEHRVKHLLKAEVGRSCSLQALGQLD